MLVFSRTQDKEHPEDIHPIARHKERGGGLSVELFVRIVADINEYLPDDWRMTMNKDSFGILISCQDIFFYMNGYSFRYDGGVIHIIDTILTPTMVVSNLSAEEDINPNLYYIIPRPDYSHSPLFARQFEKIKKVNGVESKVQYHRIHPLTKNGIDPDHFHWVRWNAENGTIKTVVYPENDFHGKNYWTLPELEHAAGRRNTVHPYIKKYNEIVDRYLSTIPQPPEKSPSPYDIECKLLRSNMNDKDFEKLILACRKGLLSLDMGIIAETKPVLQKDTYFDDINFCLFNAGMSFRLREKKDYVQITLKTKVQNTTSNEKGMWYSRSEEEAPISIKEKELLEKGERISALPCRLISYLAPDCKSLVRAVKINTNRVSITINNKQNQQAEVCVDHVYFNDINDRRIGADVEIEIESKGMIREDIVIIAELLSSLDKELSVSSVSKYERAITYLKSKEGTYEKDGI